jgi:beta-ketodecanoyl-[acyl-carrier-protein] synthase
MMPVASREWALKEGSVLPPIVTGRGMYLPEDVLTNEDLGSLVDSSQLAAWVDGNRWCQERLVGDRGAAATGLGGSPCDVDRRNRELFQCYVRERVGIESRRVIDRQAILERRPPRQGLFASDLGARAARGALAEAGLAPGDLDLVVCGTSSPDRLYPTTAVEIQGKIGADRACAFDVLAACSSFVFGLEMVRALVLAGCYRRALLVSAEFFTCGVDYRDPANCYFWGDAGVAVVVEPADPGRPKGGYEILSTFCQSRPSQNIRTGLGGTRPFVQAPQPGGAPPALATSAAREPAPGDPEYRHFYQDGPRVYREVIPLVYRAIKTLLRDHQLTVEDIRAFMFHQASAQMICGLKKRLFQDEPAADRVPLNLRTYGNTSSCGVAICLVEDTVLRAGEIACLCAFGGGYTVGTALLRKLPPARRW